MDLNEFLVASLAGLSSLALGWKGNELKQKHDQSQIKLDEANARLAASQAAEIEVRVRASLYLELSIMHKEVVDLRAQVEDCTNKHQLAKRQVLRQELRIKALETSLAAFTTVLPPDSA